MQQNISTPHLPPHPVASAWDDDESDDNDQPPPLEDISDDEETHLGARSNGMKTSPRTNVND